MSRWLNQVNNLFETLDGQVETVATNTNRVVSNITTTITDSNNNDTDTSVDSPPKQQQQRVTTSAMIGFGSKLVHQAAETSRKAVQQVINTSTQQQQSSDDDDDDDDFDDEEYDDEEYYDDEDEGEYDDEEYEDGEGELEEVEETVTFNNDNDQEHMIQHDAAIHQQHSPTKAVQPDGKINNKITTSVATSVYTNTDTTNTALHTTSPQLPVLEVPVHQTQEQVIVPNIDNDAGTVTVSAESDTVMPSLPSLLPSQTAATATEGQRETKQTINKSPLNAPTAGHQPITSQQPDVILLQKKQQQQEQAYQEQIAQLKRQHDIEISKLVQQNEVALQQVVKQNDIDMKKLRQQTDSKYKQLQQQSDTDKKTLQQQYDRSNHEVQSLKNELQAVNKELHEAATIVEKERQEAKLELKLLQEEHDDEIHQIKDEYEGIIKQLRKDIKDVKTQYENRLLESKEEHIQLGDTLEEELQHMTDKVEEAQKVIESLTAEKEALQKEIITLKGQYHEMENNFLNVSERLSDAEKKIVQAEEKYDAVIEQHRKQSQQRLIRETELEQMIAQLSSQQALSSTIDASITGGSIASNISLDEKHQYMTTISELRGQHQITLEELDMSRNDLMVSKQLYTLLEEEYNELTKENQKVAETMRQIQQECDAKIQALTQKLESMQQQTPYASTSYTSNDNSSGGNRIIDPNVHLQIQNELYESKERIVSLSDQLIRNQTTVETQKSELLALKSRLQVAVARVESTEQELLVLQQRQQEENDVGQSPSTIEIELGNTNDTILSKRRIKGGSAYTNNYSDISSNRNYSSLGSSGFVSIRNALGLHHVHYRSSRQRRSGITTSSNLLLNIQDHLGTAIDAFDSWMIETGRILRNEPLVRLGCALYFIIIHLFCFTLIVFHTIEVEHGDLGQLTDQSRVMGLHHDRYNQIQKQRIQNEQNE